MELRSKSQGTAKRWDILAGFIGAGILVALVILAASPRLKILGGVVVWVFVGAFVLNAISLLARWLLTKSWRRIFLLGRYPVTIALVKLIGVIAVVSLILFAGAGQLAGGDFSRTSLRALIAGFVLFAVVSFVGDSLLNALVVFRHLRGTLAQTSREPVRRSR
jgi:hypothetical protein